MLVFSRTMGYRHASIEAGIAAIRKLGEENGFKVFASENPERLDEAFLKTLSAVVFLNTTGDILNAYQQADLERFIQAGGGWVGIHAAADTEYDWPWYNRLAGAYFKSHPKIQAAELKVSDKNHPATAHLPDGWERTDEWYNYRSIQPGMNVLISLDESSYEGGENGAEHPWAWYRDFDGGRAFYTGGGHTDESFSDPAFLQHILGGIEYAIGDNRLDYSKIRTQRVPDETRFVQTIFAQNLDEPMELDIFDDGRIIFVERKGAVKLFDQASGELRTLATFAVNSKLEDGLEGVAIDPQYNENHWVYFFYSPPGPEPKQHVSRFIFKDDSLHLASEQVIMEVPVQREECCHSAGCLEFGPDGLLYISVGDNTNPFASDGYAPIDERPGRSAWDAQRSSGNTNDLRGKILRIKVEADGSYSIPEGNLFPKGTPNTRPEIYVMGLRNPFRLSVDSKRNWLFWGDVGPDAGKDGELRGPKGYDALNLATKPGFYGWPYFRGHHTYNDYNFAAQKSGPLFNPENPINDSPNNTGLKELPPYQKSLVWYSYDKSKEFPWVGVGGKNPMAGPVYYSDQYEGAAKFPEYFDGKVIFYEWMRHWMFVVRMDSLGQFDGADPFMPSTQFSRPMDMVFGKDGNLYMLEYGNAWFAKNPDARLSKIEYIRGNRTPIAKIMADKNIGAAPLTVSFSGRESVDFDKDRLQYEWVFTEEKVQSTAANPVFTFEKPGIYQVKLKVSDPSGRSHTAGYEIQVGNEPPVVAWELEGNQTFYWTGSPVQYAVQVSDREDGNTVSGTLPSEKIKVTFDYLPQGEDITVIAQGHLANLEAAAANKGQTLIAQSDCKNCHAIDQKVNGPSYAEIATRYRGQPKVRNVLVAKVIKGGNGNWGETVMSAHPQLSEADAGTIVDYILSLGDPAAEKVREYLPLKGVANFNMPETDTKGEGKYVFMASYTDNGQGKINPITAQKQIILKHPRLQAEHFDMKSDAITDNGEVLGNIFHNEWFGYQDIDLSGIQQIDMRVNRRDLNIGGKVEVRLDAPDGEMIAEGEVPAGVAQGEDVTIPLLLKAVSGKHAVYFVFRNNTNATAFITEVNWVLFRQDSGKEL